MSNHDPYSDFARAFLVGFQKSTRSSRGRRTYVISHQTYGAAGRELLSSVQRFEVERHTGFTANYPRIMARPNLKRLARVNCNLLPVSAAYSQLPR